MEIRHPIHPEHAKFFDTARARREFLITDLFVPEQVKLTYSHFDRIIVGGVFPVKKKLIIEAGKEIGAAHFFERREGGLINIGGPGGVKIDDTTYELEARDGLYIGKGAGNIEFSSRDDGHPAKFYMLSGPAHASYPHRIINIRDANPIKLGSQEESNKRTIYQYIHPAVLESCQLCMGVTILEENNVWNTMPCHSHERRMEVYFYFDMIDDSVVFHLAGEPEETRHIVVRNEEAVISPSWSIHSGVGTRNYSFIWGMVGENKTFDDMDHIPMSVLK